MRRLLVLVLASLALPSIQVPGSALEQQPRSGARGQQHHPDAPKLIPLSALDRYLEGAELRLFCSASAAPSAGRLQFEWRKDHHELIYPSANSSADRQAAGRVQVTMMDDAASVLRVGSLEASDGGNYTCLARNQLGADSSSVRVNVNVRLKWTKEPPGELQARAGKSLQLECEASGSPTPLISWTSLRDRQTIGGRVLRIDRLQANDSGLYECRASAGAGQEAETLRKLVRLTVNGK